MGIEVIKLFSVYLDLLHWEKEFIDEFTAVEKKFYCIIYCGLLIKVYNFLKECAIFNLCSLFVLDGDLKTKEKNLIRNG